MTAISPVIKSRDVPIAPERAFHLFTQGLDTWWPLESFSVGVDERGERPVAVRFEGRVGGRVIEVMADGTEYAWADVLEWDPPRSFSLSWHPSAAPKAASILAVRFTGTTGGTSVYIEHSGWEAFGETALQVRGQYEPGWDRVLAPFESAAGGTV